MHFVRRAWLLTVLSAASLAVVAVACDHGGEPMVLDWDLSGQPTAERIGWTSSSDNSAKVFQPIALVRFTFDDRTFEASQDIHDVTPSNDGQWLELLQVDHQPMTVEDAAELIRSFDLGVPDHKIDAWVRSTDGTEGQQTPKFSGEADQTGFGGASAWVVTRYSFNDDRPAIVSVLFGWTKSLCEAGLGLFPREEC